MLYAAILLAALYSNRGDLRTSLFALVIAFTYYFPTELITNLGVWYAICFGFDTSVLIACLFLNNRVCYPLGTITSLLILSHIVDAVTPYSLAYNITASYLEYMQIICFILVSPTIINYLKRKLKSCLQKYGCGY